VHCAAMPLLLMLGLPLCVNGAELKDPTRPPVTSTPVKAAGEYKPAPRVSAIFLSSSRRIAIFNAQPVQAGDSVGAYHIDEIDANGVRYTNSGHSAFAPLAVASKTAK
jgi:hypothetical protein